MERKSFSSPILSLASSLRKDGIRGQLKNAKEFIKGVSPAASAISAAKHGIGGLIENITPKNDSDESLGERKENVLSNFFGGFGSKAAEKRIKKGVQLLRDSVVEVYDIAKHLLVAIKKIAEKLKGISLPGGGGFGMGGIIKSLIGAGLVGILLQQLGVPVKEMVSDALAPYMPALKTLLIAAPLLTALVALKKPKLAAKILRKGALPLAAAGGTVALFGGGENSDGVVNKTDSSSGLLMKFDGIIDRFSRAIDNLVGKQKEQEVSTVTGKQGAQGVAGITGVSGSDGSDGVDGTPGADGVTRLVEPKREDFPSTRTGAQQFVEAKKEYVTAKSNDRIISVVNNLKGKSKSNINIIPFQTGGGVAPAPSSGGQLVNPTAGNDGGGTGIPFLNPTDVDSYAGFESRLMYNITDG